MTKYSLEGPQKEAIMGTDMEIRICLYHKQKRYTLANMQLITTFPLAPQNENFHHTVPHKMYNFYALIYQLKQ